MYMGGVLSPAVWAPCPVMDGVLEERPILPGWGFKCPSTFTIRTVSADPPPRLAVRWDPRRADRRLVKGESRGGVLQCRGDPACVYGGVGGQAAMTACARMEHWSAASLIEAGAEGRRDQ